MASRTLNRVKLIGNLTADPRFSETQSGHPVCSFTIATNRWFRPKGADQKQEETEFHWVVAWDKLAEICQKLLQKGSKVFLEGRLHYRKRKDNNQHQKRAEIIAQKMILLS